MLDLYIGYDDRLIAELSRNYTTFQASFGALCLLIGWTNSVPMFHDNVTFILQAKILHITFSYIDDVPVKGPKLTYPKSDNSFKTIPENPGIH
jgi:hypothetical protein